LGKVLKIKKIIDINSKQFLIFLSPKDQNGCYSWGVGIIKELGGIQFQMPCQYFVMAGSKWHLLKIGSNLEMIKIKTINC
jgi:hypothetical protein